MSWIEDSFDDWSFDFRHNGTWKIQKKLAEKEWIPENGEWNEVLYPAEAHAVYECVQVEGSEIGKIAILKLRIQCVISCLGVQYIPKLMKGFRIPEPSPPPPNENGAKYAKFNYATDNEINFLERLTDANCPATPRLLAVHTDIQHEPVLRGCYYEDEEQPYWVPGGYIVYILMEKLPGEDLTYFWTFPPQEREEIRQAFREAYLFVHTKIDPNV